MIDLLASTLLIATFALALVVALVPTQRPDRIGIATFCTLAGAAQLGGVSGWFHFDAAMVPLVISAVLLIPGMVIARAFRRIDMIAILFHREFGLKGATLAGLKNEITTAFLTAILLAFSAIGLHHLWNAAPGVLLTATVILLAANPFVRFGLHRLVSGSVHSVLPDRLRQPNLRSDQPENPDILIIYLEGTDRRFADTAVYGAVYDRLAQFEKDAVSFTRVGQIVGTGWSLAGMAASLSGVPITSRGLQFQAKLELVSDFMPTVTYLGDVLALKGYQSHYVVGGNARFGGIDAMFNSHGITGITDSTDMRRLYPETEFKAAQVGWFVDDQLTLATARKTHRDLLAKDKPFALIVETIGPHGPKGNLSRCHTASGCAEQTRDIPLAVKCMLDDVMDFVDEVRAAQSDRGRELRIVLMSDHLNHIARLPVSAPAFEGFNTVVLWGRPDLAGVVIDKPGSMIDVFPTLLEYLGWSHVPAVAGLGRSLLSDPPTLVGEFGIPRVDAMIVGDARLSNLIWGNELSLATGPSAKVGAHQEA
jgi:phosphoglycerol transferase